MVAFMQGAGKRARGSVLGGESVARICYVFLLPDQTLRRELLTQRSQPCGSESF